MRFGRMRHASFALIVLLCAALPARGTLTLNLRFPDGSDRNARAFRLGGVGHGRRDRSHAHAAMNSFHLETM